MERHAVRPNRPPLYGTTRPHLYAENTGNHPQQFRPKHSDAPAVRDAPDLFELRLREIRSAFCFSTARGTASSKTDPAAGCAVRKTALPRHEHGFSQSVGNAVSQKSPDKLFRPSPERQRPALSIKKTVCRIACYEASDDCAAGIPCPPAKYTVPIHSGTA